MTTGVDVEVLEILVIGLPGSGKTSLMKTISQHTFYENDDPADWHLGELAVDTNLHVQFMEPPAVSGFDFIYLRDIIVNMDVPAFMVVMDSTASEFFGETIGILQTVIAHHPTTPCVLVANKQDQPDAWSPDDIRMGLGIPDTIAVLPCTASQTASVKEVVLQTLYHIYGE